VLGLVSTKTCLDDLNARCCVVVMRLRVSSGLDFLIVCLVLIGLSDAVKSKIQ
jgi:hypothetical protein